MQRIGPTWSPDGKSLAWSEQESVWTTPIADGTGDCAAAPKRLIAGAS